MGTLTATTTLVSVSCYTCGTEYAIPKIIDDAALAKRGPNGRQIHCPNGHVWHYIGETEAAKLQRELNYERDRRASIAAERDQALGSLRATRGQVTKLRKRVTAGACPFGCRRHFADLERHVASKHEGKTLPGEVE